MDSIPILAGVWQSLSAFFQFDPELLADPEVGIRVSLQLALLAASAFFSGSETALSSLSRLDLHKLNRERHPRSALLHALLDSPRKLIISILCGNELVNIAAVANMTALLVLLYGPERAGILSIVIMVPLLLILGEITPKTIAVANPVRLSTGVVAAPLSLWVRLISPVRWALRGVADRITTWIVGEERAAEHILRLDEFRGIVDEIASEGELHATERILIHQLLDAGATEIVEIMTPRTRVSFIDAGQSAGEMIARFRDIRHSRVPVYQGHPDNVVGFMRIETVLPLVMEGVDPAGLEPADLISPPIVVPPTKKVDEMFDYFRINNARAAVVLSEFGGVEGIITLRDVLTFIFGHLSGELHGQELYAIRDEDAYEVQGDMKLVDFNNLTNFAIHDPRMTTIGGVAFRHLDRLPQVGDEVVVEGYVLTVLEVAEQRIIRLRVARRGAPAAPVPEPR